MENIIYKGIVNSLPLTLDKINGLKFTSREIDVMACILGGRTAKKIASTLYLSPRTVKLYAQYYA